MRNLDEIYSAEWYAADYGSDEVRREWGIIAAGLYRWSRERDVRGGFNDIGCGPGLLLAALREMGWYGMGLDGSQHAIDAAPVSVRPSIVCVDVTTWPLSIGPHSVAICTEVAEHLPPDAAPGLVRYLTQIASRHVIFTAAPPGQDGHDHLNEQPREYWLDLFADHGWIEDVESTRELQKRWTKVKRCWWIPKNLIVLR
jgi:hypothetical protein